MPGHVRKAAEPSAALQVLSERDKARSRVRCVPLIVGREGNEDLGVHHASNKNRPGLLRGRLESKDRLNGRSRSAILHCLDQYTLTPGVVNGPKILVAPILQSYPFHQQ